ncbi:MAG: hypothetical protein Q4G43_11840 [Mobilicoccus sp.]|nr:hypothetical protein [Mobilicoccus sp.]
MTTGSGADRRLLRRFTQVIIGLWVFGVSLSLIIRSTLGQSSWDVFHYGVAQHVPLTVGMVSILTGVVVLMLWVPLGERPGVATVLNVVIVGVAMDVTLALVARPDGLLPQVLMLAGGILLNGVASAMYLGSRLGSGPRDGLMTGLARRTGRSLRLVRTGIEVTVLTIGWLLGGVVGLGTVLYALLIGPLTQAFLPWFDVQPRPERS